MPYQPKPNPEELSAFDVTNTVNNRLKELDLNENKNVNGDSPLASEARYSR